MEACDEAKQTERGESRGRDAEPGSELSGLGASRRRRTPREEVPELKGRRSHAIRTAKDGDAIEVLEGERKAKSGITAGRETNQPVAVGKTPGSTSKGAKGEGGAGKPDERLLTAVTR